MQIPLDLSDFGLWLGVTSIMLLITAQLVSAYNGKGSILMDQRRLRTAALVTGTLFLVTIAIRMYGTITST